MFVEESSATVKKVLEKYTDNMTYVFLTPTSPIAHDHGLVPQLPPRRNYPYMRAG
jgi:hypothetical protein